jgi:pimeloyl-ACP methyl ester carboxylesterase
MTSVSTAPANNPVASFYGGNRAVRWLGAMLRTTHRMAPALGTRLTMRLFFTPMPPKWVARRKSLPQGWRVDSLPFDGGKLAVWRHTDIEATAERPRVLLVHGWAGDALQMSALGDALHEAGFEPVLLDFPGHGRSDGWRSTLPQFVRALFAASARLGPWHAVVAHSLGALAAAHAAGRGLPVQRLALLAPSPPPSPFIGWFARSFGLADAAAQQLRASIERREGVPLAQFEPEWIAPRLAQPTLVIHDRDDRVAPQAVSERLVRLLQRGELRATEGLGHRRLLGDAGVAAAVIDHLQIDDTPPVTG